MHTRELLSLLRSLYSSADPDVWGLSYRQEDIKAVLATREHIPNKQESLVIRKEKHRLLRHKERKMRRGAMRKRA